MYYFILHYNNNNKYSDAVRMARPFGPPLQIRGSPDRDLHLTRRRGVDGQPVRSADITFEPRYMTKVVYSTF